MEDANRYNLDVCEIAVQGGRREPSTMAPILLAFAAALGALQTPPPTRRVILQRSLAAVTLPALNALSCSCGNCLLCPAPASAISATTMTGKTKPDLGIILVKEPEATKGGVTGEFIISGGNAALVKFDSPWPLAEGGYYDIEAKSKDGSDSAFVQLVNLPSGKTLSSAPKTFFTDMLLGVDGRYGAYGGCTVGAVKELDADGKARQLEISFEALTPGGSEIARRGTLTAVPVSPSQVVMLFASTSAGRWKKGGKDEAMKAVSTFSVTTRPTTLAYEPTSDYRSGKTSGPSNMKSRNDGF